MALHSLTGTGSVPAHAQSSLPSLPAHLQSDTHLTAHLASRFHVSLPTARLSSQGLICLNTYTSSTRGPDGQREGSAMGEADDLARRAWARLGGRGENQAVIFLSVDIRTGGSTGNHSSGTISHKRWRYLGHPTQLKVGINDTEGFQQFKNALRKLEFPRSEIAEICQILACILHIGQLEFTTGQSTTTGPEESGGYSHEGGETVTIVKNKDALAIIAAFLGLSVDDLETSLGYKTKTIHRERVTVMLDPKGARSNADDLARTLYALLVAYVIENINQRVCAAEDAVANTISIIDFPGFSQTSATGSTLDQLLNNAATESLYNYCLRNFFDHKAEILEADEVSVPPTSYFDNSDAVKALLKQGNGILTILDDQTKRGRSDMQLLESLRKRFANKNPAISVGSSTATLPGSNFASKNEAATFTVRHFAGEVDYPVQGLLEENSDLVSGDLMNLITSSRSAFVRDLFGQEALQTIRHPKEKSAIMQAQVSSKPLRMPSMARRRMDRPPRLTARATQADKDIEDDTGASLTSVPGSKKRKQGDSTNGPGQSAAAQFLVSLDNINKSLTADNVNSYFVFCLKPNDRRIANQFDSKCVRSQVQTFGIAEISQRLRNADFSVFLPFSEFLGLSDAESIIVGSEQEKCQLVVDEKRWPGNEARVGSTGVFLSERCWADIARVGERVLPSYSGDGTDDDKDGMFGVGQKTPYGDSKVRLLNSPDVSPLPGSYIYGDETKQPFYGYAGLDATKLFPVQVSALCDGVDGRVDPSVPLDFRSTNRTGSVKVSRDDDPNAQYHDFRAFTDDYRPDWYWNQMRMLRANYKKGYVGYSPQYLKTLVDKDQAIAVLDGYVYDLTNYVIGGRRPRPPPGQQAPKDVNVNFMDPLVVNLFQQRPGQDITEDFNRLPLGKREQAMRTCLANLFQVGKLDTRSSAQCQFAQYFILAISLLLVTIIGFKFFAALQFGKKNLPENLDKFIICQVPAYTEDEESLRRAIDSMARMRYDDKRKLLVVICDGMIIGQGNDRPTPRIVLDILGVSDTVDPEPLSFESLGEGMKQHNMGKVYSGLYEVQGHIVPFLVVVKVGKPSEVSRPGNRGKRDSQMLLMRFLNRIHYNHPMSPLELEIHHQIRNIIGVNPTFYEFILQVDADTMVAPDSATRMVASFLQDTRIIGLCGETGLNNAKSSIITMIQVYEYYISHNLTKAFESLFGSVTCLPGCFTMYRIRAADTGKPLFVSREVVEAYAEIRVDTLHMKNLLHLGEDRYLTTLLLKHHPKYKTKFLFNAHAWTIAPDSWAVFMSQRRRWINSTVHNLIELIPLQQLCGFCCFSMRFVVFVDLLSTIIQPVTVAYVIYLIVLIAINPTLIPITAFILLGAIYGLQAIIFIVRRKWEMVGWMIIYILAMPVFSLGLPLYSFWHMDDFTWGNTRIVTGEKGRKVVISDEGKFDPASIPKKKWEEYQIELWEAQTQQDDRSEVSGISYGTRSYHPPASEYGFASSRPVSQVELNRFPGSRMSLSPSEMLGTGPDMEMVDLAGLPSDDSLLAEIRDILRTADLMTVTKKSVKLELEQRFNINLDAKRQYINSATEAVLSGQL
ncbi:chitin synthase [Histoplasma capsulatum]|uniref:chitin synthase n=1 Tax=Ajellomyces capsulatus TaxID=5037 RepID=A0A8A1MNA6_AJECA|nr:chitin synthase [Histoplasma capsulatum]